jgi:hypothetical protein
MVDDGTVDVPEGTGDFASSRRNMQHDASCSCCYQVIETAYTGESKARGSPLLKL